MAAAAGDSLRFHLIVPPFGCFQIEASPQTRLEALSGRMEAVLHLKKEAWMFWHVETRRFLDPKKSLMENHIFLEESVVLCARISPTPPQSGCGSSGSAQIT